jgi:hypothetical protein
MKWVIARNKNPDKSGSYHIRSHCGNGVYMFLDKSPEQCINQPNARPGWYKIIDGGYYKSFCEQCDYFEWLDEECE